MRLVLRECDAWESWDRVVGRSSEARVRSSASVELSAMIDLSSVIDCERSVRQAVGRRTGGGRLRTSLAFSHSFSAFAIGLSSPTFFAVRVSKPSASFFDSAPCSAATERALVRSAGEMLSLAAAAGNVQPLLLLGLGFVAHLYSGASHTAC